MERDEKIQALKEKIKFVFDDALDQKIDRLVEILDEAYEENQASDGGNKKASIDIPVRFKLKRQTGRGYDGEVKIISRPNKEPVGSAEFNFDPDQPELPMDENNQDGDDSSSDDSAAESAPSAPEAAVRVVTPVKGKRGRPAKKAPESMQIGTAPDVNEFSYRVTEAGDISNTDLDRYFAGSSRWKNYAGWIAAGNGDVARKILADKKEMKSFIELVKTSLQATAPAA